MYSRIWRSDVVDKLFCDAIRIRVGMLVLPLGMYKRQMVWALAPGGLRHLARREFIQTGTMSAVRGCMQTVPPGTTEICSAGWSFELDLAREKVEQYVSRL